MKSLFWFLAGIGLGTAGYRYYTDNGNRLPLLEQLMGGRTDEVVDQAAAGLRDLKHRGQETVNEQVGSATRQAVAAVAEEIADAERAKHREDSRIRRGHNASPTS